MSAPKKQALRKPLSAMALPKKKDPFKDALDYLESLDEGCEKPAMQYNFDTCQTSGCQHPEHQRNKGQKKDLRKLRKK